MNVAVVDDDPDALAAAVSILERAGHSPIVFATARAALAAARDGALPGVVLMDMHLPGESAPHEIAAIRRARPATLVIALTSRDGDEFVFAALRAGAVGYVLKHQAAALLAETIEIVVRGGSVLSPAIARRVVATFEDPAARYEPLSGREQQILACFAEGASYDETAERLAISVDTVRTHVRRLYAKLQVRTRGEAILAGVRRGLLGRRP